MKKFLTYILIFFIAILTIDIIFGIVCQHLEKNASGGWTQNRRYIVDEQTNPVLILGTSRALHHYRPDILEDSLKLGVFNCGLDANGLIYQYGILTQILNRYSPKCIIFDSTPRYDVGFQEDYSTYTASLRRLIDRKEIQQIYNVIDPVDLIKSKSNLYRYNYSFLQYLTDNISPSSTFEYNGYSPQYGNYVKEDSDPPLTYKWTAIKKQYFERLIQICHKNEIKLIVCFSPWYKQTSDKPMRPVMELCRQYDVPVLNYYTLSEFNDSARYFYDSSHLNDIGATAFTKAIAGDIRNIIYDKKTQTTPGGD